MFQSMRNYLLDRVGNTAIIFALGALPLSLAVGAAVDYSRASSAKAIMQAAADVAALAAAKDADLTQAKAEEIVKKYLIANGFDAAVAQVSKINVDYDKKAGVVSVRVAGRFDTSLMNLAGISNLEIDGYSEVQAGNNALEVVLVLDNTFSMSAEGRMPALKAASHAMITELFANAGSSTDIKISIVPFSDYVNVGMGNRNALWLDVKDDYDEPPVPRYISSNCHTIASDGIASSGKQECDWTLDPSGATWTKENRWGGCVGSRSDALDTRIDNLGTKYTGLLNGEHPTDWWIDCAQAVTPLTTSKSALTNAIDSMSPIGETYIPIGLLWGWHMLDSEAPFTEARTAKELAEARGNKVLVLMTDGDNTVKPKQYPWHFKSDGTASWGDVANQKTAELCDNIKSAGIAVYTVSLKVSNENSRLMLENCASAPNQAFNADDNTALVDAFKSIANSLAAIHITK
jgi:Flp pilus assembly protein TadG